MELDLNQLTEEQKSFVNKVLAIRAEFERSRERNAAMQWIFEYELSKPDFLIDHINFNWKKPFKEADVLHQNYVVARVSAEEIAKKFSCTKSTILKYVRLNNIPVREACVAINKNKNVRYGEKNRSRRRVHHEREREVIQKMVSLREKGYSYRKIAEVLDTMKVPTKTRKRKWQARVVQEILNRVVKTE